MASHIRKLYLLLVSLALVFVVYLFVTRISRRPPIDIDKPPAPAAPSQSADDIGKLGDFGVGTVEMARFNDFDKSTGKLEREFGFLKLLHQQGNEWEIEKPFMNIFRPGFECHITAETGKVQVETGVAGKPNPKDATLTGNVIIRIFSDASDTAGQGVIYLDDIIYISEKSQFTTAGPVKFISQDAQLFGKGLQLVYNEQAQRIESLRIPHLQTLYLKTAEKAPSTPPAASPETPQDKPAESSPPSSAAQAQKPADEKVPGPENVRPPTYKCMFNKNVVIDATDQMVFADRVSISNILRSQSSARSSAAAQPVDLPQDETVITSQPNLPTEPAAQPNEPAKPQQQHTDIVITCDDGIFLAPADSDKTPETFARPAATPVLTAEKIENAAGRTILIAPDIDYCATTGNTVAAGPAAIKFYTQDLMHRPADAPDVPVNIKSRDSLQFLSAANQVIFTGDCLCEMLRDDSVCHQRYTLSSQKLTVNLVPSGRRPAASASQPGIESLTAVGGVVRLATVKKAHGKLLGGIELKCSQFDYDAAAQMFSAAGPGVIKVDNSNISEPNEQTPDFSFRRKCYAFLQNFDTLRYFSQSGRITADAENDQLVLDYIPVIDSQYGPRVTATASHVDALLVETPDARSELSTLTATGGVTYEDQDKQFAGNRLFYDAPRALVTVTGDTSQPCLLNGVPAGSIKYNLRTGHVTAEITRPGVFRQNR